MGRWPKQPDLTPQVARRLAETMFVSPMVRAVIEDLRLAGAMTSSQIQRRSGISKRYLRQLHQKAIISRIRIDLETQLKIASLLNVQREDAITYTLGPVGIEMVKSIQSFQPVIYTGYAVQRVIHDVLVAETIIRLSDKFQEAGWHLQWVPRGEAAILDRGTVLEPDALMILTRAEDEEPAMFILDFYCEPISQMRASEQIKQYEVVYREGRWQEAWGTATMPAVLIAFTEPQVGKSFRDAIKGWGARLRNQFFGKMWNPEDPNVLTGWYDLDQARRINLLELVMGEEGEEEEEET